MDRDYTRPRCMTATCSFLPKHVAWNDPVPVMLLKNATPMPAQRPRNAKAPQRQSCFIQCHSALPNRQQQAAAGAAQFRDHARLDFLRT